MPYGDANAIVMDMAREVLPVVERDAGARRRVRDRSVPVDEALPRRGQEGGLCGVQNFPTVGLIDGMFRVGLEETGMGYDLEVEMIRLAAGDGPFDVPYVFNEEEARDMAQAGADVLVPHMGLTTEGTIGARSGMSLEEAIEQVQLLPDAAAAESPDILCLCHGGPIAEPKTPLGHRRREASSASSGRPALSGYRPRWRSRGT